jgi:hypothetical protein
LADEVHVAKRLAEHIKQRLDPIARCVQQALGQRRSLCDMRPSFVDTGVAEAGKRVRRGAVDPAGCGDFG